MRWFVAILILLSACGRPDALHVLPSDELPRDLYASPSPTPPAAAFREIDVYFVLGDRLLRQTRLAVDTGVTGTIQALLSGPIPEEQTAGVVTAIPPDTQVLDATVRDGIAFVNLSREFGTAAQQPIVIRRIAQVVFTATARSSVEGVRFLLDGELVDVTDDQGQTHTGPVTRNDYTSISPLN